LRQLRRIVATTAALARFNAYEQYELIEALEVVRLESGRPLECRDFGVFFIVASGAVALREPTPVQFDPRFDGSADAAAGGADVVDWSKDAPPSTSSAAWTDPAAAGTTWADARLFHDSDALDEDTRSLIAPDAAPPRRGMRRRSSAMDASPAVSRALSAATPRPASLERTASVASPLGAEHGAPAVRAAAAVTPATPPRGSKRSGARIAKRELDGESFMYRYILRESCSQFDSLPRTSLTKGASQ
jgi:hypothetical protein